MPTSIFLQIWGGIFYLLNKIFLSCKERNKTSIDKKKWRVRSWQVYILGLPGWLFFFIIDHNLIAFVVELSGLPIMLIGLATAKGKISKKEESFWIKFIAVSSVIIGISASLFYFGNINSAKQFLEVGLSIGFLIGTYLLIYDHPRGYLWFILMNLCCASLMWIDKHFWLMTQQIISIFFVWDAYRINKQK